MIDMHADTGPGAGHEHREVSVRLIFYCLVGIGVGIFVAALVVWGFFNALKATVGQGGVVSPMATADQLPPQPRLQIDAPAELHDFRSRQEQILNNYGWVDQKAGTVHIPIDQAMKMLLQRGLPVRPSPSTKTLAQAPRAGKGGNNAPALYTPVRQR